MSSQPHEDIVSLAFLLGSWRGGGKGEYPTIEPFEYREEMVFEDVGDTFVLYRQASWDAGDGSPSHFERGFLRPGGGAGSVELTLAHPLGLTEIAHGTIDGTSIHAWTADDGGIHRTRTGSPVTGIRRRYVVDGDRLTYELHMSTDDTPMALHLTGELRRQA